MGEERMTRRWRRVALVCGAVLAVVSAVPAPGAAAETAAAEASVPCTDVSSESCLLPYPSDRWETDDPTTATGVRIDMPPDVLPARILDQFDAGASVKSAFEGADGFSTVTPIFFELPTAIAPLSLPADGGEAFVVYDVTSGERVPIRAEVSLDAGRLGAIDRIVVAWPASQFDYGHRFVAVLTDKLTAAGGGDLPRAAGLDEPASQAAAGRLSRIRDELAKVAPDMAWSSLVSATAFTVRSQANVTDDLDAMAKVVRSSDHPIRSVRTGPSLLGGAAQVSGQVRVTDFRDSTGAIPHGGTGSVSERWIDFVMVMPAQPASPAGAPVAIYGHGLSAFKETMSAVAGVNASKGIATVGVDIPNHGTRQHEGGWLFDLAKPQTFGRLLSMPLQGEFDHLSLLMAIQQHFGDLDQMPWTWWSGETGDGVADLDTSRIFYQGTSMGGILGASFVALAPELDGAFLQVAGSGILDTLYHSILWLLFSPVEPTGAPPGDTQALVGTVSMLLDRAENTNLLDRIKAAGTPLWLAYARHDGVVPNTSSDRMIELLDLPLSGPMLVAVPSSTTRVESIPANGTGASQNQTSQLDSNLAKALMAHVTFADPGSKTLMSHWLEQRLEATAP